MIGLEVKFSFQLRKGEVKRIHFPVLPTKLGRVTINMRADTSVASESVSKTITVTVLCCNNAAGDIFRVRCLILQMDGIRNTYHTTFFIDLVNKGSSLIPDFSIPIPERFYLPQQRERLYVPGSQSAALSIAGDVLGPVFSRSNPKIFTSRGMWQDAPTSLDDHLFRVSYNVQMLKFLRQTNQLEETVLQATLSGIRTSTLLHHY